MYAIYTRTYIFLTGQLQSLRFVHFISDLIFPAHIEYWDSLAKNAPTRFIFFTNFIFIFRPHPKKVLIPNPKIFFANYDNQKRRGPKKNSHL